MYRKGLETEYYTRKARAEGYPARSIYKLKDLDEKYRVIRKTDKVLDLGSSPGSWLMYLCEKLGSIGRVVGIDTEDITIPKHYAVKFIKKSIFDLTEEDFKEIGTGFDVVVADLSPKTTGVVFYDVGKSLELSRVAFEIAERVLRRGGNFVCKIFEGEDVQEFVKNLEGSFSELKRYRPKAIIKRSKEFYVIGLGYGKRN